MAEQELFHGSGCVESEGGRKGGKEGGKDGPRGELEKHDGVVERRKGRVRYQLVREQN